MTTGTALNSVTPIAPRVVGGAHDQRTGIGVTYTHREEVPFSIILGKVDAILFFMGGVEGRRSERYWQNEDA